MKWSLLLNLDDIIDTTEDNTVQPHPINDITSFRNGLSLYPVHNANFKL